MRQDSTPSLTIDEAARRRFEQAWREGRPEPIEQYLPPDDHPHYLPTLTELVQIELEMAWKSGDTSRLVEVYLARFPRLDQPDILLGLLRQEHQVRHRHGDRPTL